MSLAANNLDYLTVDSIEWATGHARPRMALEDKRAKHRVHQRQFVLRQRQRMEQLRRDFEHHRLQLLWLEGMQEAEALKREYEWMQQQLLAQSMRAVQDLPSFTVPPSDDERISVDVDDDRAVMELLDLLPDIKAMDIELREDSAFDCLVSPTSPTCPFTMVEMFV